MKEALKYKAFISYSRIDREWAQWLHRRLETFRIPKSIRQEGFYKDQSRLTPIFRDRDELASSPDLQKSLHEALDNSDWLILVCSPTSAASPWVGEEVRRFISSGRRDRIIAFIVDGSPDQNLESYCFPPALEEGYPQGEAPVPLAADARPEGDGKYNALMKVIAGMLGISFGRLLDRERIRSRRKFATWASVLLMLTIATAAGVTEISKKEKEASAHRVRLSREKKNATDLLSVVQDIRLDMLETHRLIELEKAIKGVEGYLIGLPDKEKDLAVWHRIGDLGFERASILHLLGRNEEAIEPAERSIDAIKRFGIEKGEILEEAWCARLVRLGNLSAWIGDTKAVAKIGKELQQHRIPALRRTTGDSDYRWCVHLLTTTDFQTKPTPGGLSNYEALQLVEESVSTTRFWIDQYGDHTRPGTIQVERELLAISVRMGQLAISENSSTAFGISMDVGMKSYEILKEKDPDHANVSVYGGQAIGLRGDASFLAKNFKSAKKDYEKSMELLDMIRKRELHRSMQPQAIWVAVAHFRLAAVHMKLGKGIQDPEAISHIESARSLLKELAARGQLEKSTVDLFIESSQSLFERAKHAGIMGQREQFMIQMLSSDIIKMSQ